MTFKFFFKPIVTIPMVLIIAGIIIHFMFHIRFIYIHKLFYLIFVLFPFAWHFFPLALPHLSVSTFLLFCFIYCIGPIWHCFLFCVYPLIPYHSRIFMFT
jgi:hypothetical protein